MTHPKFNIIHGDCFAAFASLPDNSADCMIVDPPYGTTNLSFDKLKIDWKKWWEEVDRVCKPSAVQISFAAQPFTTDLINSNRRSYRYSLIWKKTQSVGFLSANQRPLRAHEDILIFCRKFGRVQGVQQSTYNPQMTAGKPYHHRKRTQPCRHYANGMNDEAYDNPGTRHPTSVLTFARDVPSLHPTAKPVKLLSWLIKSYSNVGDVVLDPFAGSGSTGVAAILEGRKFVGMELDPEYHAIAFHRLREAQEGRV